LEVYGLVSKLLIMGRGKGDTKKTKNAQEIFESIDNLKKLSYLMVLKLS